MSLENELGVQLLARTTRKLTATDAGLAYYERALQILADLEEADQAVRELHGDLRGTLRLNAPMSFGMRFIGPAVADFMREYPRMRVALTLNDRFVDLLEEGQDLTIRLAEPAETMGLITRRLLEVPRIICASPAYLDAHAQLSSPTELRKHRCLHYGHLATGNRWRLSGCGQAYEVQVNGVLCSNNAEVLHAAALAGLGVAMLPEFVCQTDIEQGRLVAILKEFHTPPLSLSVIYARQRHLSAKIGGFCDFLSQRFAQGLTEDALI